MEKEYRDQYLRIFEELFNGYKAKIGRKKVGILVSGGIDSSIVAHFVSTHFPNSSMLSLQSEKSVDDDFVEILGNHFKVQPLLARVTREDLVSANREVLQLLKEAKVERNVMQVALASVYYFLFKEANRRQIEVIFTGQGPDVLLAGYNKYKALSGMALKAQITRDLVILETDKKRDSAIAKRWGLKVMNPYLELKFVDFALSVPSEFLIYQGTEKYLSRVVGAELGLPIEIVNRPKKAMQYSTGVQKILK